MLNKAKAALLLSVAFLHVNDEPTSADPVARYVDDKNPGKIVRGKSRLHLHGATLSDSFVYGRQPGNYKLIRSVGEHRHFTHQAPAGWFELAKFTK